jgi:hypothetical protein
MHPIDACSHRGGEVRSSASLTVVDLFFSPYKISSGHRKDGPGKEATFEAESRKQRCRNLNETVRSQLVEKHGVWKTSSTRTCSQDS